MANLVRCSMGVITDTTNDDSQFDYKVWKWTSNDTFRLNDFIQMPSGMSYDEGYEWKGKHWGTHEVDCDDFRHFPQWTTLITFYCAWCPPVVGIVNISKMFPNLMFILDANYSEQPTSIGTDLKEHYEITNGEIKKFTSTDPNEKQW